VCVCASLDIPNWYRSLGATCRATARSRWSCPARPNSARGRSSLRCCSTWTNTARREKSARRYIDRFPVYNNQQVTHAQDTPTEKTPPTPAHTRARQDPQTNTSHKHLTTLNGGTTTVRATSHARVGGRAEVSMRGRVESDAARGALGSGAPRQAHCA